MSNCLKMIKIQGRIKNLNLTKTQYHVIKNQTRTAQVFSRKGTKKSPTDFDTSYDALLSVEALNFHFYIDDKIYNGTFTKIFFEENDELVCIVNSEKVVSILDPKRNLLYMPNGVIFTSKDNKSLSIKIFVGSIFIFSLILFF